MSASAGAEARRLLDKFGRSKTVAVSAGNFQVRQPVVLPSSSSFVPKALDFVPIRQDLQKLLGQGQPSTHGEDKIRSFCTLPTHNHISLSVSRYYSFHWCRLPVDRTGVLPSNPIGVRRRRLGKVDVIARQSLQVVRMKPKYEWNSWFCLILSNSPNWLVLVQYPACLEEGCKFVSYHFLPKECSQKNPQSWRNFYAETFIPRIFGQNAHLRSEPRNSWENHFPEKNYWRGPCPREIP